MTNLIDTIKDFALPERSLFPCDTPSLTSASAEAFDSQHEKLPAREKLAAARHITKRAHEHGVAVHDREASRVAGTELSPMFKVALHTRKEATAWDPKALQDLKVIDKLAELVVKQEAKDRALLFDKLAETIESFDSKWDPGHTWRECGIPDAVDTVFAKTAVEIEAISVGARVIRPADLARFDKTAAEKILAPATMKLVETWSAFKSAQWDQRAALAEFIR